MAGTIHATAVALFGQGVLLTGPPACGKSDLALRLIDRGATLVADDRVAVALEAGRLRLSAPAAIAGLLEVRGVGILALATRQHVPALILFDLAADPARLPEPDHLTLFGARLPRLALRPFEASAPLKVERAVALARTAGLWGADADR